MSFLSRIFGGSSAPDRQARQHEQSRPGAPHRPEPRNPLRLHGPAQGLGLFPLAAVGESNYQTALWRAVGGVSPDRIRHYVTAALVTEPDNPYDVNAIAVLVPANDGYDLVGYLSRDDAEEYIDDFTVLAQLGHDGAQCDAVIVGGGHASGAPMLGIWLHLDSPGEVIPGAGEDPREFKSEISGPVSTGESRNLQSEAGLVRGKHYTRWVDDVTVLKRNQALGPCRDLLQELIEAVERESTEFTMSPAPWYYEQMAIVLRKMRDFDGEVAVIERYLAFPHPTQPPKPEIRDRLTKAQAKQARAQEDFATRGT